MLILAVLILFFGTINSEIVINENCRTNAYPPAPSTKIPKKIVNLDAKPIDRWKDIVKGKTTEVRKILDIFKQIVGEKYLSYVNTLFGLLVPFLPQEYGEELRGISEATGIELGEVTLYNVFYELFTACTSIVGHDAEGKMYHARNMDFGLLMGWDVEKNKWLVSEVLRKLLINVEFQRNNKTVYTAITFVGYVGVLTAHKKDAFTFSIDERFTLNGGWAGLIVWALSLGKSKAQWLGFFTRDVMLNANNYADAKTMFMKKELIAPAYFILGGVKPTEGCIITRDRAKVADLWELKSEDNPEQWYLLETNYDHWEKPLFFDDRRTPGNVCMRNMTSQGMGPKGLFNVLSTKPVLNKLTVYTALMQVHTPGIESYVQDCADPCWPW